MAAMNPPEVEMLAIAPWEEVLSRLPSHRREVALLCLQFPHARDLVETNPALALCISCATAWDTLSARASDRWVEHLLSIRRRRACGLLGFPETDGAVRILAKIVPEACSLPMLMRLRRAIIAPGLCKILCHIPAIWSHELVLAAFWDNEDFCSVRLFRELAMQCVFIPFPPKSLSLLRDTAILQAELQIKDPPRRSIAELRDRNNRLTRKLVSMPQACVRFPAPPIPGTECIVPISTTVILAEEGIEQYNCVARRRREIEAGISYIYRVLAPERATLEIYRTPEGWALGELLAAKNRPVKDETLRTVQEWLERQDRSEPASAFARRIP